MADRLVMWRAKAEDKAGNKGREDQRQRDVAEGVLGIRAQAVGRLFDGRVDLLQRGDAGAHRSRQAAHGIGRDDDIGRADQGQRRAEEDQ